MAIVEYWSETIPAERCHCPLIGPWGQELASGWLVLSSLAGGLSIDLVPRCLRPPLCQLSSLSSLSRCIRPFALWQHNIRRDTRVSDTGDQCQLRRLWQLEEWIFYIGVICKQGRENRRKNPNNHFEGPFYELFGEQCNVHQCGNLLLMDNIGIDLRFTASTFKPHMALNDNSKDWE